MGIVVVVVAGAVLLAVAAVMFRQAQGTVDVSNEEVYAGAAIAAGGVLWVVVQAIGA